MAESETVRAVASRIESRGLSLRDAAGEIGVTEDSLARHLGGEYVRSDSVAKYRVWLNGGSRRQDGPQLELIPSGGSDADASIRNVRLAEPIRPPRPHRVVDLFSGCGGLSLGFDLAGDRQQFDTVLALDIEEAMVATLNRNHHRRGTAAVGRRVDLADFINETEVRAFYLEHLATIEQDPELSEELAGLQPVGLGIVLEGIRRLDHAFLVSLEKLRSDPSFLDAYSSLDSRALGQTSVVGFHRSLRLPLPSSRVPTLEPLLWAGSWTGLDPADAELEKDFVLRWLHLEGTARRALDARWEAEVWELGRRSGGSGRGQLASSAKRITQFLAFLARLPELKLLWLDWRARRDSLRFAYFEDPQVERALSAAYTRDRRVAVVLGGPPCQGFSRIGRGKLRSLRDDRVQVHYDEEAGDLRNRLFEKYVLFVEALGPPVFLFENVRHFQTKVQTPEGTFLATEVLAEAVRNLSEDGLNYDIASRTVLASEHGVPQARERFFMVGVRREISGSVEGLDAPSWVLALPKAEEVPLRAALEDLPQPFMVGERGLDGAFSAPALRSATDAALSADRFRAWIRQPDPRKGPGSDQVTVDSHVARDHRGDDRGWFALMGPGKRWMDYRCDLSPTLGRLRDTLEQVAAAIKSGEAQASSRELEASVGGLLDILDGSLTIRLLLESIPSLPGELEHHLLKETYLRKREGNHGDWLSRLDPDRPSKTIVTHMGKDTYAYVHPWRDGSLSVREAARIQTFPDWFSFGNLGLVDAFRVIGNAVPPLLSLQFADRVAQLMSLEEQSGARSGARAKAG